MSALEVGGVPEEIPSISAIPGPAEIVIVVVDGPWLGALRGHDGVELSTFQQLGEALDPGNVVSGREGQPVPDVEVTAAILRPYIVGVLRE